MENVPIMGYYFTSKIRQQIGKNIKRARKRRNLKQVDLAVEAGVSPGYYGRLERGVVNPSLEKIYAVVRALGVRSSDVLPF